MIEPARVHPFAIQHDTADGLHYLHCDRALNANGQAYDSNKWPDGFSTDAEARAFAKERFGATDDDFAANQQVR